MFGKRENDDQQWNFVCFCCFEFQSNPNVGMLECLQIIAFQQRMGFSSAVGGLPRFNPHLLMQRELIEAMDPNGQHLVRLSGRAL